MGRSQALGMDRWSRRWARPRWRLAQGVPQVQEEGTIPGLARGILRVLKEEKLRVRAEEKVPQQADWEQVAMWD
jgi:hypothetical protein